MKRLLVSAIVLILVFLASGVFTSVQAQEPLPAVAVGIKSPETAVVGHQPVTIRVVAVNVTAETQVFQGEVWVGGPAWGRENYPYSSSQNSEIYNVICSRDIDGCIFYWSGSLAPREKATFTLPTFTGYSVGTYEFVRVIMNGSHYSREIEITAQ